MPSELLPVASAAEAGAIEAAVGAVPGVGRAVIVPDENGRGVLRLSLSAEGDEVLVARAVHRILRLQFGVGLEPDQVEVVAESLPDVVPSTRLRLVDDAYDGVQELGEDLDALLASLEEDLGPGPRFHPEVLASAARHPAGSRPVTPSADDDDLGPALAIARLTVAADGLGVRATVELLRGTHEHRGTAEGSSTADSVLRVVAAATLDAVDPLLGPDHRVDVEAVSVAAVGAGSVAVVQVRWASLQGDERLTGASEVRDDPRQAVIRATLDAVNRRLAHHLED